MSISDTAMEFFNTCEAGKGWEACKQYCHDGATFSCQADALADVTSVEGYTEWVKGLLTPIPDMRPDIRGFGVDDGRNTAVVYSVVHGTHSGDGPVPPTGKTVAADYVYAMEFDGDKIRHMTKIWNDGHTLRQLGWA